MKEQNLVLTKKETQRREPTYKEDKLSANMNRTTKKRAHTQEPT